jgi:histidine triad (HIT) family protein
MTRGELRGMNMEDCIFCRIADGKMEADIIYADDQVLAFRDISPQAPVHFLVIPRKHIQSALHIEGEDASLLFHIFEAIKKVSESEGVASRGVRILTNSGREADQVVMHMHFHVLGGRKMLWPPG